MIADSVEEFLENSNQVLGKKGRRFRNYTKVVEGKPKKEYHRKRDGRKDLRGGEIGRKDLRGGKESKGIRFESKRNDGKFFMDEARDEGKEHAVESVDFSKPMSQKIMSSYVSELTKKTDSSLASLNWIIDDLKDFLKQKADYDSFEQLDDLLVNNLIFSLRKGSRVPIKTFEIDLVEGNSFKKDSIMFQAYNIIDFLEKGDFGDAENQFLRLLYNKLKDKFKDESSVKILESKLNKEKLCSDELNTQIKKLTQYVRKLESEKSLQRQEKEKVFLMNEELKNRVAELERQLKQKSKIDFIPKSNERIVKKGAPMNRVVLISED